MAIISEIVYRLEKFVIVPDQVSLLLDINKALDIKRLCQDLSKQHRVCLFISAPSLSCLWPPTSSINGRTQATLSASNLDSYITKGESGEDEKVQTEEEREKQEIEKCRCLKQNTHTKKKKTFRLPPRLLGPSSLPSSGLKTTWHLDVLFFQHESFLYKNTERRRWFQTVISHYITLKHSSQEAKKCDM